MQPAMISGMIQRTDDIGYLKNQQDSKPIAQQQNVQTQIVKKQDALQHQVMNPEQGNKTDTHADAREEGKGNYFFRKKSDKRKDDEVHEDRVIKKTPSSHFDIKI